MRWASSLGCYLLVIIGLVTVFAPGLLPPYRGVASCSPAPAGDPELGAAAAPPAPRPLSIG